VWQTSEGLPQNGVNALVQTSDGFLWVGTSSGLARFDGMRFRTFGLADGLGSVQIVSLHEDAHGVLWIGTVGGGVSRWENGSFITLGEADGFRAAVAQVLASERDGTLWIGTERGLVRWQNGLFKVMGTEEGIPVRQIRGLLVDSQGVLWVSVLLDGLYRRRTGEPFTRLPETSGLSDSIYCLSEDDEGAVWVGSSMGRLWQGRDMWQRFAPTNGLPKNNIELLAQGTKGEIWIGARTSGLYRFIEGRFENLTEPAGLSEKTVRALLVDRDGTVWAGTVGNGLHRLSRRLLRNWGMAEGLGHSSVSSIAEDDSGLWVATQNKGIWRLQEGRFHKLNDPGVSGEYPFIYATASSGDGSIWAAGEQCMFRFRSQEKTVAYLKPPVRGEAIRALCADGDSIWMGTYYSTLLRADGTNILTIATNGSFAGDITSLVRESPDTLWIGTSGGLYRWERGIVRAWTTKDGLLTASVRALHRDPDGTMWIGTVGGGLARLKDGRIMNMTSRHGLPDDTISQIVPDDFGNLWLGCNHGLAGLERCEVDAFAAGRADSVHPTVLGRDEGMLNEQCSGGHSPTALKCKDGRLLFPTMGGIVELDPRRIQSFSQGMPRPLIEEILVDNQRQPSRPSLIIPPGSHRLEIVYTAPSLRWGEWVRFRTRLDGLDRDWVPAGTGRTAVYAGLGPGRYVFHVAASDSRGVWNANAARLEFVIQPHFWQTAWFGLAVAAILGGAAFAFYRARIGRWESKRLAQEEFTRQLIGTQEAERARLARELHDDITQRLARLAIDAGGAERDHGRADLAETMQGLRHGLTRLSEDVHSLAYKLHPSLLDDLGLAEALKAECERFARQESVRCDVNLRDLPDPVPREAALGLFRITQEALRNIGRHARAGKVSVTLRSLDGGLQLAVQDDGVGFEPGRKSGRVNLGVAGMKERVHLLGGELDIETAPGQGTTIVVWVPMPGQNIKGKGQRL
jgi:ligand-binding sensor domain-containing protein/signal transduction histidine kinase